MRIISYFQGIIKEQRITYSSLVWFFGMILLLVSCQQKSQEKEIIAEVTPQMTSVVVLKDALVLKPTIGLVYFQNQPFTGISKEKYANGIVAETIEYVLGKKNGVRRKWFQTGLLSFKANYIDGKQHGTSKTWWRNGNVRSVTNHANGIVNGMQEQWYITGEKFKQLTIVNGKEEGLQKAWRKNGKLFNNYEAKNGRIFGLKRSGLCYELQNEIVQTK
ncbi:toxin-antitoxin system YwqK family antitoxin [Kordia sp.]|uniref:toxin-antitoxin system YwqK family antitoxin n=1 Tax=Kordia sp. TaxID=1965332 RepID=UPI003D2B8155